MFHNNNRLVKVFMNYCLISTYCCDVELLTALPVALNGPQKVSLFLPPRPSIAQAHFSSARGRNKPTCCCCQHNQNFTLNDY